ncbi:dephospho-CoA kinase [Rhodophyticola porphyridii]|uniref:Dephospho-CoA kinase n=1 Tax=Rhodophyticola porphyridii TaxID=1852017 RepID=A0A3L9Y5S2_9RHOB|nr:dephospho-CoA kinase [Rhodophyticola porphyridii]RMA42805.1 dephospho-CoA kinase [Rhodophyticola porphyridii]
MSFILGLTGSIGMGKSTTAGFFRDLGIPVWDADETVHRLYSKGGAAVSMIAEFRPDAVRNGCVDRAHLKAWIAEDPAALSRIEAIVHPLVAADRAQFLEDHAGQPLVVLDIPLLFETEADLWVDGVLVVTAAPEVQRARVFERPGMTEDTFNTILSRQMPDAQKRARADYVIETKTLDQTRAAVETLVSKITRGQHA